MFLHQKTSKPTKKLLKLALKLDFDCSSEDLRASYNVEKHGNGLKTRYKKLTINFASAPHQIVGANGNAMYVMMDESLISLSDGSAATLLLKNPASDACSCVYRGSLILSGKDFGTYVINGAQFEKVRQDGFSSLTSCADRIFGLYKDEVFYTAAGKADGWEQGQTITLSSQCQAVTCVGEKVYALGNDCYVLIPKADDVEFKVLPSARNVGKVAKASVVNYNGAAVFATSNGLFRLSSDKVEPICQQLNSLVDLSNSLGAIFNKKYYLSCKSLDSTEKRNDVTICIDLDEEEVVGVLRYGFDSMCATDTKIYGLSNGVCYSFSRMPSDGKYVKSNVDFATYDKKFLDKLLIKTVNDLDVTIRSETETRLYKLKGKNYVQKLNLRDMGWKFSIELLSNDGLDVENAVLFAHTCGEA